MDDAVGQGLGHTCPLEETHEDPCPEDEEDHLYRIPSVLTNTFGLSLEVWVVNHHG